MMNDRRYPYNNSRLYIEEIPVSPGRLSRRGLPPVRDATPSNFISSVTATPLPPSGVLVPLSATHRNSAFLNASMELNSTQAKVKQLESRLQVTEVSNRALLEEVIRLQNDLALSLRKSFDSIQEERNARQLLENNLRLQNESVLQMNGRIKRAEDSLQEDRTAVQSLIVYTRNLEQQTTQAQNELNAKRDVHAQRLDDQRAQIDDLLRSREGLERNSIVLLDEIKNVKSRVDQESANMNVIGSELRTRVRRLEDEGRAQNEVLRKQQESISNTDSNLLNVKSYLENRVGEVKDITVDLRNRIEMEKEEKRILEQQLAQRFGEVNMQINEEKQKYVEAMRAIDNSKREIYQNMETDRARLNAQIAETRDAVMFHTNDRVEKAKEDLNVKLRDVERSVVDEANMRLRSEEHMRETFDMKLDGTRRHFDDEVKLARDEMRDLQSKSAESIRKLNEGLNLIEQQNDERYRQFEKVISAEIKLRKNNEREFNEKLDNYNEKFSYAIQSFQANVSALNAKINEHREMFVPKKEFENMEKRQERVQAILNENDIQVHAIKESIRNQQTAIETQTAKIRDLNEVLYKIDNVQIPALNTRLSQMTTRDEFVAFKKEHDIQFANEMNLLLKQNEEYQKALRQSTEDKLNDMSYQLSMFGEKYNQKLFATESLVKEQIALQNEGHTRNMNELKEETNKQFKQYYDESERNRQDTLGKLQTLRSELHTSNDSVNQRISMLERSVTEKYNEQFENNEIWKRNVNDSIDKLKSQQDYVPKELTNLESKFAGIRQDLSRQIQDETRTRNYELDKVKSELNRLDRNFATATRMDKPVSDSVAHS